MIELLLIAIFINLFFISNKIHNLERAVREVREEVKSVKLRLRGH